MDIAELVKSFAEKIPVEQINMLKGAMPVAKAAIDTAPIDEDEHEKVFILKVTNDNLTLDIAVTKIIEVNGEPELIINRTIGGTIKVIPDGK